MSRRLTALVFVALMLVVATAQAQTRAWLDRDRVGLGETATLNVETDASGAPDYAPLLADFDLGGQSSEQRLQWVNGRASSRSVYAVGLRPRRQGLLRIPALRVGGGMTAPLSLLVTAAAPVPAAGSGDVYIESEADAQDPYVQQSVGWVVRLYSAVPLIAGQLDQPEPQGATLQRVGDDVQYRRTVGVRNYVVTERRFLLIPERSGELVVPPARFEGRGTGNAFDRLFGDGQTPLRAVARPRVLRVRGIPADAPQPWLPLRDLTLRYLQVPTQARTGSAVAVQVELVADGATAAQLPALDLPAVDGLQVFPERAQSDESVVDGRPRVRLQRRYSLLPSRAGRLETPGPRIDWWDTRAGTARTTQLPPITLDVAPGPAGEAAQASEAPATGIPSPQANTPRWWRLGIALAMALSLFAFAALRSRRTRTPPTDAATPSPTPGPAVADPNLPRLLEFGDLAEIDAALRHLAGAGVHDLDGVIARLDDPTQRAAVESLRRARWAGADAADARSRLRAAFAAGPRWRVPAVRTRDDLPPLYPGR
ncbi:BatD family protein [Lysobacter xanthus]